MERVPSGGTGGPELLLGGLALIGLLRRGVAALLLFSKCERGYRVFTTRGVGCGAFRYLSTSKMF